jgi:hypothetical protein
MNEAICGAGSYLCVKPAPGAARLGGTELNRAVPGSRHNPGVEGGALIALFYLPAGRMSYHFKARS